MSKLESNFTRICSYLSAERAIVLGVLCDFHLLDGFTEGSTVTGSIFTDDSDLLGAFGLEKKTNRVRFLLFLQFLTKLSISLRGKQCRLSSSRPLKAKNCRIGKISTDL